MSRDTERPTIPASTRPAPDPVRRRPKRFTMDLPPDNHTMLRLWALDRQVPASLLVMTLVDLAINDPAIRARVEHLAADQWEARSARQ